MRWLFVAACSAALAACGGGGGGGNVRPAPPPAPPPPAGNDLGFTPTIANDAGLAQPNPPALPAQGAPLVFASGTLAQHLQLVNAAGALGAGLKGQGVAIGLLDSGVNRNHPTLAGRVSRHFVNVNPANNDLSVDDKVGHGTTVASLAAGRPATGNYLNPNGSNSGSTATWGGGVAQDAGIVSSRIIGDQRPVDDGSGQGNEIRAGEGYGQYFRELNAELAGAGARIINNSWGGLYWNDPALTTELGNAWRDFIGTRGGLIVFATGNEGRANPTDNAALPSKAGPGGSRPAADLARGWLAVTAVDPGNPNQLDRYTDGNGQVVVYPNACGVAKDYCLAAPGTATFINPAATSQANSGLYRGSGTSYAAPLVSGAAAVVWSAFPYLSNDQVRQLLLAGARDIGAPGVDEVFGWGLLDVSKSARGPSQFAWGDFSVSFSGHSVWRNPISGSGGLVKSGSGTLTLAEAGNHAGGTRVLAGGLDVRKGLAANLSVSSGATVWASGGFGGNVSNAGNFFNGAGTPARIAGNYSQAASGNLGVWLGSKLSIDGSATLAGQLSILGVKSGYATSARETLLTADGGISGSFATTRAAPNVFLDASVAYDPNNVYLDIRRIDVSKAVAGAGLSAAGLDSAARLEGAMQAIDAQLAGGSGGIGNGFINGAAALQQVTRLEQAARAVDSLSGELHVAADNLTLATVDAQRRALVSRMAGIAATPGGTGAWSRRLGEAGEGMASAGRFEASGWSAGRDLALGNGWNAGLGFGQVDAYGRMGEGRDRGRDRQHHALLYLGRALGQWQAMALLGSGSYQRQVQRSLLLGDRYQGVASDYRGRFAHASVQLGRRMALGQGLLTPYVGADLVQLRRDGFAEAGADGFGLRVAGGTASRSQALAGVRWQQGGDGWRWQTHAEWQQVLAAQGFDRQASYVGVEAWAPLANLDAARSGGLFGLGMEKGLAGQARLWFGYEQRLGPRGDARMFNLGYRRDF